jgi:transposase-like protein
MEMETAQTIRKRLYTREFKEEAVRQYHTDPDRNMTALVKRLGITDASLRNWIREKETGHWDRKTWKTNKTKQLAAPTPARLDSAPAAPKPAAGQTSNVTEAFHKLNHIVETVTKERDLLKALLAHYMKG